ncbi:MAG TPA: Crp/Fnr family transcriptional regulator [Thermoanaerobaculia bacterium]|nr:Crp/Fnr family transcriptional regulator [Thermoanaerobaculia bacterium]
MSFPIEAVLRVNPLYRSLSEKDRKRLAEAAQLRSFARGETLFAEGDPSELLHTIVDGRVKLVKVLPIGREVILEILGPGDPVGAIAALQSRPYPATAVAIEPASCILIRSAAFFHLIETCPSLVRGLLVGLSFRLIQLTQRIAEVSGSRVEVRFARLFAKLAERMGEPRETGVFIPISLSRQDLADLTGTTIETAIRIMSRWAKEGRVLTEKEGFLVPDVEALAAMEEG